VSCGALTLAAGYFCLALDYGGALLGGLCVLAIGNGLFKPNISALVGSLYDPEDGRRDEAFGIFYLAVNAGGLLGPLLGELLRTRLGWRATFSAAGIALIVSYLILRLGGRHLGIGGRDTSTSTGTQPNRNGMRALLLLCIVLIPFWMAYYQQGSSLVFWARDGVNRTVSILGLRREIPPGWFSASSAMFVVLLTTPLAVLVKRLRWTSADKIRAGVMFGAGSFALLWLVAGQAAGARVHPAWLLAHYLTMTIGELLLAPYHIDTHFILWFYHDHPI
jgi:POT family proton-dependent oligopeptide transporter